ncbi:MAG: hypothetical protein IPG22_05750 [Acidobacteria bacterium]|nr:hypothetical protein [Acidobacteriota bacterium]
MYFSTEQEAAVCDDLVADIQPFFENNEPPLFSCAETLHFILKTFWFVGGDENNLFVVLILDGRRRIIGIVRSAIPPAKGDV